MIRFFHTSEGKELFPLAVVCFVFIVVLLFVLPVYLAPSFGLAWLVAIVFSLPSLYILFQVFKTYQDYRRNPDTF